MTMVRNLHLTEICKLSMTLGVKFQLLTRRMGFEFIVNLKIIMKLRCAEAGRR
jgi:hypothetical protein